MKTDYINKIEKILEQYPKSFCVSYAVDCANTVKHLMPEASFKALVYIEDTQVNHIKNDNFKDLNAAYAAASAAYAAASASASAASATSTAAYAAASAAYTTAYAAHAAANAASAAHAAASTAAHAAANAASAAYAAAYAAYAAANAAAYAAKNIDSKFYYNLLMNKIDNLTELEKHIWDVSI